MSGKAFGALVGLVGLTIFLVVLRLPPEAPINAAQPAQFVADQPEARLNCDVAYVNDGDTLRCRDGTRVRLHAISAREADETCSPGHPCPATSGASATTVLRELTTDGRLSCEPIGRSYGRVTAICWNTAGVEINCAMIRSGTAVLWERFNRVSPICRPT